ncbi:hypothetical protein QFZ82_006894 [Streptomyces sp. V4I23]|uniref:hypothetical protein n=1 Tax=Streptomyces sp. V4I23 TaxID=3042282 RepID=UPI00277FC566|nr:hypothetical protein [Streptomyces sp. V4I23]MDQ1012409.1 hypothetical protein [Streptomyces sp. V4I23]
MGRASRSRKEVRNTSRAGTRARTPSQDERLEQVLSSVRGRQLSSAAGLFMGYAEVVTRLQAGTAPPWHSKCDPLDLLFLGMCRGKSPKGEASFANARDAWLDVLRENRQWPAVAELLERMLALSNRLDVPIDTPRLFLELSADLSTAERCMEALPLGLHPAEALAEHRSVAGINLRERLPEPTRESHRAADAVRALAAIETELPHDLTPADALRIGLRTLTAADVTPADHELVLLALCLGYTGYAGGAADVTAALARERAQDWVAGLPERAPVTAVADLACRATARRLGSAETLARLMTLPQVHVPAEPAHVSWRSEVGIAAVREALALRPGTCVRTSEHEHIALGEQAAALVKFQRKLREAQLKRPLQVNDPLFDPSILDLPEPPWLALLEEAGLSVTSLHASRTTGLIPPGPAGFARVAHQRAWRAAIDDFLHAHPEHEKDYDPKRDADVAAALAFTLGMRIAAIDPSVGAGTIAEIRRDPDGPAATMTLRTAVTTAGPLLDASLVAAAKEHARAFDGHGLARDIEPAATLLSGHREGFTDSNATRQGRRLAPALFCLTVAAAARTPR